MSEDKILKETTKTVTEKGLFQPKSVAAKELAKKAIRATTIGKIAAGVAGAGLAAKAYLKSKMNKEDKIESKMGGGKIYKANDGMSVSDYFGIDVKEYGSKEERDSNKKTAKALAKEVAKEDKIESKMGGGMMKKYSSGGDTKLSPKQMKIARMAPPTNKITGADFKAMKASNGKMVMSRGCKIGRNKPTKLS